MATLSKPLVKAPVTEKQKKLAFAEEQYDYCYDIVEQGMGTVGKRFFFAQLAIGIFGGLIEFNVRVW